MKKKKKPKKTRCEWKVKHPIYVGGKGNVFAWVLDVCMRGCVFVKRLLGKLFGAVARPQTLSLLQRAKITFKLKVFKVMLYKYLGNSLNQERKKKYFVLASNSLLTTVHFVHTDIKTRITSYKDTSYRTPSIYLIMHERGTQLT